MPELMVEKSHPAPDWLNQTYVEHKLRIYLKDEQLKVKKLLIKPAIGNGENYASVMMRINVDYTTVASRKETQTFTFLVKTTFEDKDLAADLLKHYGIYTREINMYEHILPQLAIVIKAELHDERKLFASTVSVDRQRDSIMFEDMTLEQYQVADRLKKLDLSHVHLVLEKLAEFHAAAAALNERQPGIFADNYDRGFFNPYTRGYQPVMQNALKTLSRSLESDPDLKQRYQAKIDRLVDHIMNYGERSTALRKDDFVTLNHGDLWTTNMMFKYDSAGRPSNCIFIDFQFSVWNSPAIDLHYFFSTSMQEHLRLHQQIELVQYYYYHLTASLKKLRYGGRIPSLFDFQLQFQARSFYAVFSSLIFEPCMLYNGEEESSIEKFISNSESGKRLRESIFQADVFRNKLPLILPIFDHKGLLDEM